MAMETINALTDDMESGTFPRESTYGSLEKSEHEGVTSMNEQDEKSHPAHNEHLQKTRQYYRDMMLGVNDGLVSTLLLVAGVVGGGMDVTSVLLTAISGAIAGAISMFAGELVATKSQNEVMRGEIKLEQGHIANYHTQEMQELSTLLALIGIPESSQNLSDLPVNSELSQSSSQEDIHELRRLIKKYYAANTDALLKLMIALELGVVDGEVRSPFVAGATSFGCFIIGSLPSALPFAFVSTSSMGLLISGVTTAVGLCIVGVLKSWATRGNFLISAIENLSITVAGGGIAYGIGVGFQRIISD